MVESGCVLADDLEWVVLLGVQRAEELVFKKDEVIEDGKRIATSLQVKTHLERRWVDS